MRLVVTCYFVSCIYAYAINRGGLLTGTNGPELDPPLEIVLREEVPPSSEPVELDPYSDKPRITFNEDGSFKLTIFSDVHFGENPWDSWGPEQDINTTALMKTLLKIETPDYV